MQAGHSMGVRAYLLGGPHYDACRLESKQLRRLAVLNLVDALGDLDTLSERVQTEVATSNTVVSFVRLVGVWARKPANA